MSSSIYELYIQHEQKISHLNAVQSIVAWDRETNMPPKAGAARAQQMATLANTIHELNIDSDYEGWLKQLEKDPALDEWQQRNIALSLERTRKNKALPNEFVASSSLARSKAVQAWQDARKENNFDTLAPHLEHLIYLKRRHADYVGYEAHPYNALLDQFEPDLTCDQIDNLFRGVKAPLIELIQQITATHQVDDSLLQQSFSKEHQWDLSLALVQRIGYDFSAGRQDLASHPFSIGICPEDVRITTRWEENNLAEIIFSSIHEAGHALYEQGLPEKYRDQPLGTAISLGIHESQSRLWENNVARSLPFWEAHFDAVQSAFPQQMKGLTPVDFYRAVNRVEPSFIRTAADEITYHLHVMIRYELEKSLIEGSLSIAQLKEAWNEKYHDYLGITPANDVEGILQDIHWSLGNIGYFPTYSIGSFYAAQFFEQACKDLPALNDSMNQDNLNLLLKWLRQNIHEQGKRYSAEQLCERICGEALNPNAFIRYAQKKYGEIYKLELV